jgi:hypothetical protein
LLILILGHIGGSIFYGGHGPLLGPGPVFSNGPVFGSSHGGAFLGPAHGPAFTHGPIISSAPHFTTGPVIAHGPAFHSKGPIVSAGHVPTYGVPDYEGPAHYDFSYGVQDSYHGTNFGQSELRDGYSTQGTYYVSLPDGRLQTVDYHADDVTGYVADVKYTSGAPVVPGYHAAPIAPIYHPAPAAPIYHPAPVAPIYHPAPVAPIYHSAPSTPIYNTVFARSVPVSSAPLAPSATPGQAAPAASFDDDSYNTFESI